MFSVLLTLLIIITIMMVGIILVQKSEGSGMSGSSAGSMFGGAMTGAAAGNFMTKLTAWLAVAFFVIAAALAVIVSRTDTTRVDDSLRYELLAPAPVPIYIPEN